MFWISIDDIASQPRPWRSVKHNLAVNMPNSEIRTSLLHLRDLDDHNDQKLT